MLGIRMTPISRSATRIRGARRGKEGFGRVLQPMELIDDFGKIESGLKAPHRPGRSDQNVLSHLGTCLAVSMWSSMATVVKFNSPKAAIPSHNVLHSSSTSNTSLQLVTCTLMTVPTINAPFPVAPANCLHHLPLAIAPPLFPSRYHFPPSKPSFPTHMIPLPNAPAIAPNIQHFQKGLGGPCTCSPSPLRALSPSAHIPARAV